MEKIQLCDLCRNFIAKHWFGRWDERIVLMNEIHICNDCKIGIDMDCYNDYESIQRGKGEPLA